MKQWNNGAIISILIYLTFFFFSFGQLGRISFFGQQVNLYVYEVFAYFLFFLFFLRYGFKPITESFKKYKSIYIFFAVMLVSFLAGSGKFNLFQNEVAFLYLLRLVFYFAYFFYLSYLVEKKPELKKVIMRGIVIFGGLTFFISLIQYFYYPDLRNLFYQGWDPHLYRLFGVFFDAYLAAAVFGLLFFFFLFKIKSRWKWLALAVWLSFITLTFSRGSYVAFLLTSFFYFLRQKLIKYILLVTAVFIVLLLLIPKPSGEGVNLKRIVSIESRLEDNKEAINIWLKQPVLGIGYDRIRYVKKQINEENHAGATFHNSFLIVLVTSGIFGLLAFLKILFDLTKINVRAQSYLFFLSIFSFFDNVLLHAFVLFLFFSLLSLEVGSLVFRKGDS